MKTTLRALALAIMGALVLSGCIKMEYNLELQSDNTVNGTLIQAVQEGFGEMWGEGEGEAISDEEAAEEFFSDDQGLEDFVDASAAPYREGEWVGTIITFRNEPLETFSDLDGVGITRDGDTFVVSGVSEEGAGDDEFSEMFEGADMTMSVTFPGAVSQHNGTLSGTTVTWDLLNPPADGLQATGSAIGSGGGGDFPWVVLLGVGLLVLIILAVVVFVVLGQRKKAGAPTDAPAAAAAE